MDDDVQRTFGTVPVDIAPGIFKESTSDTITLDELVVILSEITTRVRDARSRSNLSLITNDSALHKKVSNAIYKEVYAEFKVFANEFPLIFRNIASSGSCDKNAFRNYINNHHKPMWKDKKEMLNAQIEYIMSEYRAKNRKLNYKKIVAYRAMITKEILLDNTNFEDATKEAKEISEKNDADRLQRLKESIMESAKKKTEDNSWN